MGARLRQLRLDRGESLAQAAIGLGCTKQSLSLIENGRVRPHWSTLDRLVAYYGCTLHHIICGDASIAT